MKLTKRDLPSLFLDSGATMAANEESIDEELGVGNTLQIDNNNDDDGAPSQQQQQHPAVGHHRSNTFSSFFEKFKQPPASALSISNEQQTSTSTSPSGQWKSIPGSRKIKFARCTSDVNNGTELRGIVATPIDSDQAKPMPAGVRFLKNIQTEVADLIPAGDNEDDDEGVVNKQRGLLFKRSSTLPGDDHNVPDGDEYNNAKKYGGSGDFVDDNNNNNQQKQQGSFLDNNSSQMYRLQATRGLGDVGCFRRTLRFCNACVNCGALTESATEQNLYLGFANPNRWLIDFFFWLFRKGWSSVIILSVIAYYTLVLFFSLLIVWAADMDNDCVRVGGLRTGDIPSRSLFMDAFSLSWNTFSTVGYGSTYPALSTEATTGNEGNDSKCAFINFITSFEALAGVLYSGFIGAIFFAKFTRITQRANIRFSDPLTVRYGSGVDENLVDDDEDKPDKDKIKELKKMSPLEKFRSAAKKVSKPSPFPVITFRIANEMHNVLGGEIISATVNAVVLIESTKYEDQICEDLTKEINMDRMKRASMSEHSTRAKLRKAASSKKLLNSESTRTTQTERTTALSERTHDTSSSMEDESLDTSEGSALTYLQGLNALAGKAKSPFSKKIKIDEEESGSSKIVPRMVFTKLKLETSEHPLFKRIWRFKHIINQDSPLLTPEAQRAIMNNNGKWPWEWNNDYKAVRKAIRFDQMIVSFTGTSNISGATVYAQKVYDYVDIVVGYQFCNALYRGRRGTLKVDLTLINDVIEQNGGGGEPLNVT